MFRNVKKNLLLGMTIVAGFCLMPMNAKAENAAGNQKTTYYQRTPQFNRSLGAINLTHYNQNELEQLTSITHGEQYRGNTSLDAVSSRYVFCLVNVPIPNFMGEDGILQLYNESEFMTDEMVQKAAEFWNRLAGTKIVELVFSQDQSDEVIHDSPVENGALGGQTYSGEGILFYPNQWKISSLKPEEQNDWKASTLIHEIGHALGIPHLGGGEDGYNAQRDSIYGTELMAPWATGVWYAPKENAAGVKSSDMNAASLALAALSWEKAQKVGEWILTQADGYVNYHNGELTSNLPFGIEIDFKGNFIQQKQALSAQLTIIKNYNVYEVDESVLNNGYGANKAKYTTTTQNLQLIGKEVEAIAYYPSTKGNPYYKVRIERKEYVINSAAFQK